ncbi:hypothetical protein Ddye_027828 [Dipteronia dyeriana]|uniref:Uncharacterized protein n=1 Tax=Dipteronia dyeriana TaxID=168575 RepID=A0AAD9TQA9_9ROSI|nr:hypothetical protein Ddye_027828 [Dipteronia dyeriana]
MCVSCGLSLNSLTLLRITDMGKLKLEATFKHALVDDAFVFLDKIIDRWLCQQKCCRKKLIPLDHPVSIVAPALAFSIRIVRTLFPFESYEHYIDSAEMSNTLALQ